MKKLNSTLLLMTLTSASPLYAVVCEPPSSGQVTYTFSAGGNSCIVTKSVTSAANSFNKSSSGASDNGLYYRIQHGCNSETGQWGIDPNSPVQCEPLAGCSAVTDVTYQANDKDGVRCNLNFSAIPEMASGEKVNNGVGRLECFHGQMKVDKDYAFTCPPELVFNGDEEVTLPVVDNDTPDSPDNSDENNNDTPPALADDETPESGDSPATGGDDSTGGTDPVVADDEAPGTDANPDSADDSSSDTPELADDNADNNSDDNGEVADAPAVPEAGDLQSDLLINGAAAAYGIAMGSKCVYGSKAKSYELFMQSYKTYHENVLANVQAHKDGVKDLKTRMNELKDKVAAGETENLQKESLELDKSSLDLKISLYRNHDYGLYISKVNLLEKVMEAQQLATTEYEEVSAQVEQCTPHLAQALEIANTGCNRTKMEPICPPPTGDDDVSCTAVGEREVPDPVPGSCIAAKMLPRTQTLVTEYKDFQYSLVPSNLQALGYENILKNYNRLVTKVIPEGEWKAPLFACEDAIKNLHIDYGVKCESAQGRSENMAEWDIPGEGTVMSDIYLTLLDRLPDLVGNHSWGAHITEKMTKENMSEVDAIGWVIARISESTEYRGEEPTELDKQQYHDYMTKNNIEDKLCEDAGCGSVEVPPSGLNVVEWYSSIEAEAKFASLLSPDHDPSVSLELKTKSFEFFNQGDLFISMPYGRVELIPEMEQIITEAKDQDDAIVKELTAQRYEIIGLLDELENPSLAGVSTSGDGSSDSAGTTSGLDSAILNSPTAANNGAVAAGTTTVADNSTTPSNGEESSQALTLSIAGPTGVSGIEVTGSDAVTGTSQLSGGSIAGTSTGEQSAVKLGNKRRILQDKKDKAFSRFPVPASMQKSVADQIADLKNISRPTSADSLFVANRGLGLRPGQVGPLGVSPAQLSKGSSSGALSSSKGSSLFSGGSSYTPSASYGSSRRSKSRRSSYGSSRRPASVKSTQVASYSKRSGGTSIDEIYSDAKRKGLIDHRPQSKNEINKRNTNLFNLISKRYISSGLKVLSGN